MKNLFKKEYNKALETFLEENNELEDNVELEEDIDNELEKIDEVLNESDLSVDLSSSNEDKNVKSEEVVDN